MSALLMLSLSGCASYGVVPPGDLTEPCEQPEIEVKTWRDIAELARLRGDALDECDARMREIRALYE